MKKTFLAVALCATTWSAEAAAFCGFYVGGAGADLYANATQVVLMREGTTTVLSMQNRYDGPAEDFAMVVPVPVVLMQDDVKTLEEAVFAKVDRLTAPRLVEYKQQDPCYVEPTYEDDWRNQNNQNDENSAPEVEDAGTDASVVVEAEFKVGEYDVAILSANDSSALETYLTDNGYNIPDGAAPYFQPYVQSGMYFFVAKVDISQAPKVNGSTVLSPLRFAYTSPEFSLPVRLGMINSSGVQDLIVYTLGRDQRFEVANAPNVTIPTNLELTPEAKPNFSDFYLSLLARTYKENPEAVVTEYAWQASNCDPCPGPVIDAADLLTLGADLFPDLENDFSWVITRLHARYDKDEVGEDLVFKAADPIVGGREFVVDPATHKLEEGAKPSDINNFQGRYIIRYPWTGPIDCANPNFNRWGTTQSSAPSPNSTGAPVAFDETTDLAPVIVGDVPELGITGTGKRLEGTVVDGPSVNNGTNNGSGTNNSAKAEGELDGGGCNSVGFGTLPFAFGLLTLARRRRRKGE